MLSSIWQINVKVTINLKKELKLKVVQEKLKSKKELELQELEVLNLLYSEEVVQFLAQDQEVILSNSIKK